jgi:hypothetical protein
VSASYRRKLMFWIERLISSEGRQAFVIPEHDQELGWCSGGDGWKPSVGVGTPGRISRAGFCRRDPLSVLRASVADAG